MSKNVVTTGKEQSENGTDKSISDRREFLAGALSAAGLAATLNTAPAQTGPKRVCLLLDTETH